MTDGNVAISNFMLFITLTVFDFVKNLFKFSHAANFLVEKGAHQVLVSYDKLISLGNFVHVRLWLVNLDEYFQDVEGLASHESVNLFDFRLL